MSEYRLAEKPAMDVLAAMGWQVLPPASALAMRQEENRVILKPVLIEALRELNGGCRGDLQRPRYPVRQRGVAAQAARWLFPPPVR